MSKTIIVKDGKETNIPAKKEGGLVHNVIIMDASSSMNGGSGIVDGQRMTKYGAAQINVNEEIRTLRADDQGDVRFSLFEFDSVGNGTERITEHLFNSELKNIKDIKFVGASGNTPLYQTIAYVINRMLDITTNKDVVILKIFTDGAHNCNWGVTEKQCKTLIKDVEDRRDFVVTFIGTQTDVNYMVHNLGLEAGNTFSLVSNDASGFRGAGGQSVNSTMSFMSDYRKDAGRTLKSKSKAFYKEEDTKSTSVEKKDDNNKV